MVPGLVLVGDLCFMSPPLFPLVANFLSAPTVRRYGKKLFNGNKDFI